MKLFIATPAYDSKVDIDYCLSMFNTLRVLDEAGVKYHVSIEYGDCYVAKARNKLAREFLESDCTHLLFIDADLGWDAENVLNLLRSGKDICLGAYTLKENETKFPIHFGLQENGKTIVEGDYIRLMAGPTGFMCIERKVFEGLKNGLEYTNKDGKKEWNFFHCGIIEGKWWGEDFDFCLKATNNGFEIWCYTDINFRHHGLSQWQGNCKEKIDAYKSQA